MVLQSKFKAATFLFLTGTVLLSNSFSAYAMEEKEDEYHSTVTPQIKEEQKQEVEYVTAKQRLELVKSYYETYPGLTMLTPVKGLYEHLYLKDLSFIKQEIKKRTNQTLLERRLNDFDEKLVQERYSKEMSFADYNYIGQMWTWILNQKDEKYNPNHLEFLKEEYDGALEIFKKHKELPGGPVHLYYIQAPGIILPHVSPTGSVPILVLNNGFGFFMDNEVPHSVDFLAVGTQTKLSYDYFTDGICEKNWYHDYEHIARARRYNQDGKDAHISFASRIYNIASLRNKIKGIANLTDPSSTEEALLRRRQAELAFFMIFHESQKPVYELGKEIKEEINKIHRTLEIADHPTTGFHSEEQYITYIKAVENLKLPLTGKDYIDKYKDFLRHVLEGCEILKDYASDYDVYYKNAREEQLTKYY